MRWRRIVVGICAIGASSTACSLPDGDYFGAIPTIDPRTFRFCNQGEPDHLDPAYSSSLASSPLVNALFDGLTVYGMDGLPQPSLATGWTISDDVRTFKLVIRDDARWSNGRPLDAFDIAYSLIRIAHPRTASPNGDNLAPIDNVPGYLARRVYVLRDDMPPYHAGDIVELATPDATPYIDVRTSRHELALRDLGADQGRSYARVESGHGVEVVMQTGGRATWPSPHGQSWSYVYASELDVYGWVPTSELDLGKEAAQAIAIKRGAGPVVQVRGADLAFSPDVLGIRVIDAHALELTTTDPTPSLIALSSNRAFRPTPIEAVSRSPRHWAEVGRLVSSGAMQLDSWIDRDRLELVRSPTYWNQPEIGIDRLIVRSMDDQAASTNTYFTGGCDALATNLIPSTYLPAVSGELRGRPYKDYTAAPWLGVYWAWLNTEKLANRHLRRALALAIDRTQIPRFTHGGEIPSAQLTPGTPIARLSDADLRACGVSRTDRGVALVMESGSLCYVPPPGLDYDLDAAKRELAIAARELGDAFPRTLTYRYNAGAEAHTQIAEYLQDRWRTLGIDVQIIAEDFNALLEDTRTGNYEIARLGNVGAIADTETEFLPLFHCGAPDNRARYCNPAFERLIDEARPLADRRERNAKIRAAEAVMIEDAPLIPLYVYTQKHLVKPYVKDFAITIVDQPPLWRVHLDPDWRP